MTELDFQSIKTNGIKVNYLYVCERKLWFFDKGIQMESNSDRVLMGKILGDYSYPYEKTKNILIDNLISIDIAEEDKIREVKYSNRLAHADRIQLLYYLYYLKQLGIYKKGIINYPKMRKKEEIELTEESEKEVEQALLKVKEITSFAVPPPIKKKPYCTKCAYYEFCFSGDK
ncbi:MAG: CRISPR-associated protein Cas4 [Thermodesulfovibrio sp.]|jgi:CRISPR-associated exonuclease Cas4|uniref:CRISPR-associated protein Cas4 n=1 Tax=Thermodesulfovibrio sp. 1176 TaxID=3043424 RepID=UPI00248256FA|nr:CRISPR-associated protein Cas4 [Thermodesulfovibrio sp. 1176]MDI1471657.1 CRISPR-associated protein Cas4 [Thermodesulfovibrio sp. 1176]MDI6713549.1 CRISPR-associated protein Cas4 [Thermodesulfovibrio sp.]